MRILLGNQTLSLLAGSETWTQTLAEHLKKLGHDVVCFSPTLGIISERLAAKGILSVDRIPVGAIRPFSIVLEPEFDKKFDLIISNHYEIVTILRQLFPDTMLLSTVHGVLHFMEDHTGRKIIAPEHPAIGKADQFVAVSEEVQEKLRMEHGIDSIIIRNFFDIPSLKAKRPASPGKPKNILFNTNYAAKDDQETKIIGSVARHFGARVIAVGQNFVQPRDLKTALEDADIVVGMGRSVLEGLCAGRLGIVHGRWGTGGVIHAGNVDRLRRCNFSGRDSGGDFYSVERLIEEIETHYNPETIAWGEEYVKQNHNVAAAAQSYLAFAGVERAPEASPVKKLKFQSRAKKP